MGDVRVEGNAVLQEGFDRLSLSRPALVCRWRLAGGRLPLANRHLRALRSREVGDRALPAPLVAWAKEHIDWTLEHGARRYPDGVLLLVVDERLHAAMAVGPYRKLESTSGAALVRRAFASAREADRTNVAPETLWRVCEDRLEWFDDRMHVASGAATFVRDMAQTLGLAVTRNEDLIIPDLSDAIAGSHVFLVSDEHGVVVPSDQPNDEAERYATGYRKLLASTMRREVGRGGGHAI